jgi:hypothetical protein
MEQALEVVVRAVLRERGFRVTGTAADLESAVAIICAAGLRATYERDRAHSPDQRAGVTARQRR